MKKVVARGFAFLVLLAALGLLYLANIGWIPLGKAYIRRFSARLPAVAEMTAFVNVNILPMDGERVLPDQTVLVRDGLIQEIGPTEEVRVPRDAFVVDGAGKYLMPGLVDMHVHVMHEDDLLLFAANGVTTVRNMWGMTGASLAFGFPDQLALREAIRAGELFGPAIYTYRAGDGGQAQGPSDDDRVDLPGQGAGLRDRAGRAGVRRDQGVR